MNDLSALIADTAAKVFADAALQPDAVIAERIEEAGFRGLLTPEDRGGFGGGLAEACSVMRVLGGEGVSLPLGDLMLGARLEAEAGLGDGAVPLEAVNVEGQSTTAPGGLFAWMISGAPKAIAVVQDRVLVAGPRDDDGLIPSLSGRPMTVADFASGVDAGPAGDWSDERIARWRSIMNAALVAGAVDQCLRLTIDHVTQRQQFGRPLSALQAVQQQVAILAARSAAVSAVVEAAARAGEPGLLASAAAAIQSREAATLAISIAHQLHGAMGVTEEYPLHRYTVLLMECRSRGRRAEAWAERVGRRAVSRGGDRLWSDIVEAA